MRDILTPEKPPEHLSKEAKRIWKQICGTWSFENSPDALLILRTGLESFDRLQEARKLIDSEGLTVKTKNAQGYEKIIKNPNLETEKQARAGVLQSFRMLGLDFENSGLKGRK
jgi:P27 family predicted phage terminase small subunit